MSRTVLCLTFVAAGVVSLAACGRAATGPRRSSSLAPDTRSSATLPDTNVARIFHWGRSVGSSRREISTRLGDPVSVRVEPTPNRHGPGLDSIFRLDYGTRVYWVRRPAGSERELLELAEYTERGQRLAGDVVIQKTTFEQLRERFGQPIEGKRRGDTLMVTYRAPGEGADEFVRFDLVKDIVRRVVWIFYVD